MAEINLKQLEERVKAFDNELVLKKVQMPTDVNMNYDTIDLISEKLYIKV